MGAWCRKWASSRRPTVRYSPSSRNAVALQTSRSDRAAWTARTTASGQPRTLSSRSRPAAARPGRGSGPAATRPGRRDPGPRPRGRAGPVRAQRPARPAGRASGPASAPAAAGGPKLPGSGRQSGSVSDRMLGGPMLHGGVFRGLVLVAGRPLASVRPGRAVPPTPTSSPGRPAASGSRSLGHAQPSRRACRPPGEARPRGVAAAPGFSGFPPAPDRWRPREGRAPSPFEATASPHPSAQLHAGSAYKDLACPGAGSDHRPLITRSSHLIT